MSDVAEWRLRFDEHFDASFAPGRWPGAYAGRLLTYADGNPDTSKVGQYHCDAVSVHDSCLDWHVHTRDGVPTGGVVGFDPTGSGSWRDGAAQTYGRFAIRFRSDPVPGYGVGFLLWDAHDVWANGEIDFPECALDGPIEGHVHTIGNPRRNAASVRTGTVFGDGAWHDAIIEWRPGLVRFELDGGEVLTSPESPSTPMRWTLQVGTRGRPAPGASGHVLVDRISAWELGENRSH